METKKSEVSGSASGMKSGVSARNNGRRSTGRGGRSAKKIHKQKLIIFGLSLALFLAVLGWIFSAVQLSSLDNDYRAFRLSSRQELEQRAQSSDELKELKAERDTLVKGMIPGLQSLKFDETIEISEAYFRNIAFTLTGTSYSRNYEYRIVLHNDSLNIVFPKVSVFLFDARGIQVGTTQLSKKQATSKVESESLQPNETRAYTGRVELNLKYEPSYFLVRVD